MINNDVLSSQAANRQRRHAADDRARFDRISTDTAVREGVARQAGEAPSREEVTRFSNLMRAQGQQDPSVDNGRRGTPNTRPHANPAPRLAGELAGMNSAERFRALMQQAFAKVDDRGGGQPSQPETRTEKGTQGSENRAPVRDDKAGQTRSADAQAESARSAQQQAESARSAQQQADPRKPMDGAQTRADAGKAGADGTAAGGKAQRGGETTSGSGASEADAIQQAARKAADGEAQVGQAARVAHGDEEMEGGEESGSALAQGGAGSTPTPMSADMAQMPAQPQPAAQQAQQAAASGQLAPALSELVQKHVKQMLISDPRSQRGRSREVLLRMQNDVLPGTDLWLTQTDDGWQLRADVRSRDAYDTLLANQDELMQRFADSALGKLSIEPVYHG